MSRSEIAPLADRLFPKVLAGVRSVWRLLGKRDDACGLVARGVPLLLAFTACGGDTSAPSAPAEPDRAIESESLIGSWSLETESSTACWGDHERIGLDILFAIAPKNDASVQGLLELMPIPVVGRVDLLDGSLHMAGVFSRYSEAAGRRVVVAVLGGSIAPGSSPPSGSAVLRLEGYVDMDGQREPFSCSGPVAIHKTL